MSKSFSEHLRTEIKHLDHAGLYRQELLIGSPQGAVVTVGGRQLLNFTSSDYLGLANHPEVKLAAMEALEAFGAGLACSRMMGGTLTVHAQLEQNIAQLVGAQDAIVYASGYEACAGLFEPLLSHRDYVFADEQISAPLADGLRLCRGRVYSFRHQDMVHLEDMLRRSRTARYRFIVTDGVFPLSGLPAQLSDIYALAEKYDALVVTDDTQGVGVLADGQGSHRACGIERVDLVTGTFGHVLGGAGGFVAGRSEIIGWLKQKSRPYLSGVALSPSAASAALKSIEMLRRYKSLFETLRVNVRCFRDLMADNGLWTGEGEHPAVGVLIRRSITTQQIVDQLFHDGILTVGFCPPVVPEGASRVRVQITVGHTYDRLKEAVASFVKAANALQLRRERPPR